MGRPSSFQYDRFQTLRGEEVISYMEPLMGEPGARVPADLVDQMLVELPDYDEYHLVYALELLGRSDPEKTAPHVPEFLAHRHVSVCCAASRVLQHLPDALVTCTLVEAARIACACGSFDLFLPAGELPPYDLLPREWLFANVLHDLETRLARKEDRERKEIDEAGT